MIACATLAIPALAEAGSVPTRGELHGLTDRGPIPLPLIKTKVLGHISGALASVKMRQTFHNPNVKPLEAIYVFPLPDNASIHGVTVTVGERVVRGVVRPRSEAVAVYEKAKKEGKLSALLEQERPNIFTQTVANILPKSKVVVDIEYDVQLEYQDGYYEFAYPMVVGARYIPGAFDGKVPIGFGTHPDTDQVPDASRITPPVKRSGRTIDLAITIDPGALTREIFSPTHKIIASAAPEHGPHALRVSLAKQREIPNKDFVVRYRLAADKPSMSAVSHRDSRGGFVSLRFVPPSRDNSADATPRELAFVIDASGSGAGKPLAMVKQAIKRALRDLDPADTFEIITFSNGLKRLASAPLPNTEQNVAAALRFVDAIEPGGRSEMMPALRAALVRRAERGRLRILCVASDGHVGNDRPILAEVAQRLGPDSRVFALGLGSAPNRFLLERMVEIGRGSVQYLLPSESAAEQIERFYRRLRAPLLTHIAIDWKGLGVAGVEPRIIPDVYAGEPVEVVGTYTRPARATVEISGRLGGRAVVYKVPVVLTSKSSNPAIARQWARAKVRRLTLDEINRVDREKLITRLGMQFSLMTAYTGLVAVVGDVAVAPGDLRTKMLSVERPEGQDRDGDGVLDEDDTFQGEDDAGIADGDDDEDVDKTEDRKEREDTKIRVGKASEPSEAGSVAPAPGVSADDSVDAESVSVLSRTTGAFGRRYRLTLGAGFGASSETTIAGSFNLGFDRLIGKLAIGLGGNLQLRSGESETAVGAGLLQVSHLDLLGTRVLRLEVTFGAGVSITGERAGLGLSGSLKLLPRRLPVGLQLRYDGALRFDARDLTTVTTGLEIAF